jgi:hypothetical protein
MYITNFYYIIVSSVLISISMYLETVSFLARVVGYECNMPSSGYSFHVQISTFARLGTLMGMPLVGILIDNNNLSLLLLFPIIVSSLFIFKMIFTSLFLTKILKFMKYLFYKRFKIKDFKNSYKINFKFNYNISIYAFLSHLFVNVAFFSIPIFANLFFENRAFILQLSGLSTGFGTFIGIFYFDHKLSILLDNENINIDDKINIINNVFLSRFFSMTTILILSIILYNIL